MSIIDKDSPKWSSTMLNPVLPKFKESSGNNTGSRGPAVQPFEREPKRFLHTAD